MMPQKNDVFFRGRGENGVEVILKCGCWSLVSLYPTLCLYMCSNALEMNLHMMITGKYFVTLLLKTCKINILIISLKGF